MTLSQMIADLIARADAAIAAFKNKPVVDVAAITKAAHDQGVADAEAALLPDVTALGDRIATLESLAAS